MTKPRISQDPMYVLLREGKVEEFNAEREAGKNCDLTGCNMSRIDLRNLNADGLDLSDCYFRMADLRGLDLRKANLEGASFATANISGVYFPNHLSVEEIQMSITHGTRVRYTL